MTEESDMNEHKTELPTATGRVVYNYPLVSDTIEPTRVAVGPNSKIVFVAAKPLPAVWIEQERSADMGKGHWISDREWDFLVLGSGREFPLEMWEHAGSCMVMAVEMTEQGPQPKFLVWHVYWREVPTDE